jgi:selenium-binding protein 1
VLKYPFFRDAFLSGEQEKLVYIPCIVPDKSRPDYLVTVDVDPKSTTYSQVIIGELHCKEVLRIRSESGSTGSTCFWASRIRIH